MPEARRTLSALLPLVLIAGAVEASGIPLGAKDEGGVNRRLRKKLHLKQSTLVRCHAVGPLQDGWHGSERAFLEADLAQVDQLLNETPDDGSLGRRSLEQHRERVRAELEGAA